MHELLETAYDRAIEKIVRNSESLAESFPHVAIEQGGKYNREQVWFWTGGFWGGLVNLAFRETHDEKLRTLACCIEDALNENLDRLFLRMHHDVGFLFIPTAVCQYERDGSEESFLRGMKAASILASRFNIKGAFIRAWNHGKEMNGDGEVIIDCMMNLSLLYWASKKIEDPRFFHIAKAHATTVLRYFVREDWTVPHVVDFDADSGAYIGTKAGQGYSPVSSWSRGQAWAIYGFAISYRETKEKKFLDAASNIAEKYLFSLPSEGIPYWDFDTPEKDKWVFDSSSACIAASGLLELYSVTKESWLKEAAIRLLTTLTEEYAIFDDSSEAIIQMGTVNYAKKKYVNVPIIYGDFFYVEALGKLKGLAGLF